MNRIGVFALYDIEGIVDDYIIFLLGSLRDVLNKIYVMVNGKLRSDSEFRLNQIVDKVILRENIGYDGGAYKDFFKGYYDEIEWEKYDELVMFNDTFYGPVNSWNFVFEKMRCADVDFWGLSRYKGGYSQLLDAELPEHIQSYFIVVRKRMFMTGEFIAFWQSMRYPDSYVSAIRDYEVAFTYFFKKLGYRYTTFIDAQGGGGLIKDGEVVYLKNPCELVVDFRFPVIKKKVFGFWDYGRMEKLFHYLKSNSFDMDLIINHMIRMDKIIPFKPFSLNSILLFFDTHEKVYIYGHGKWGHSLECYASFLGCKIAGFVVSEKEEDSDGVVCYREMRPNREDGIIVALSQRNSGEVYRMLCGDYVRSQILMPQYC